MEDLDNFYMHRVKHDNTDMLARIRVEVLIVAGSDNLLHHDQNQYFVFGKCKMEFYKGKDDHLS